MAAGGHRVQDQPHALTLNRGQSVPLKGDLRLGLRVVQLYRLLEAEEGGWKASTTGYKYRVDNRDGAEVFAYHWHPGEDLTYPHLHLGQAGLVAHEYLRNSHLPTGVVTLEQVIGLLVGEFAVEPLRDDWEGIIAGTAAVAQP